MTTKPRRRWFRFTLRTVFVLVTVICVWLGWQAWIVHERKAVLAEANRIAELEGHYFERTPFDPSHPDRFFQMEAKGYTQAQVPRIRQFMGDVPYQVIFLPATLDPKWIERAEHAFPETDLYVKDYQLEESIKFGMSVLPETLVAKRPALDRPSKQRHPNRGVIFKTGEVTTEDQSQTE